MSLHKYLVPPPLVLAVHPAPPPKTTKDVKEVKDVKDPKDVKGPKDPKADKKGKDGKEANDDHKDKPDTKPKNVEKNAANDVKDQVDNHIKPVEPVEPVDTPVPEPATPLTPASMIPEPPTPGTAHPVRADDKAAAAVTPAAHAGADADVPAPKNLKANPGKNGTPVVDSSDKGSGDGKDKSDTVNPDDDAPSTPLPAPEPLRLLCPAPNRPPRARLDLDPSRPYPPIVTDPRGAYHKYAKAVQAEMIYVDVTKDGWLVEQWREKPEREGLEALTGEAERRARREMEANERRKVVRKVPETAEGLIKDLWNDLVEAESNEVSRVSGPFGPISFEENHLVHATWKWRSSPNAAITRCSSKISGRDTTGRTPRLRSTCNSAK
jgi:hypothetical protein